MSSSKFHITSIPIDSRLQNKLTDCWMSILIRHIMWLFFWWHKGRCMYAHIMHVLHQHYIMTTNIWQLWEIVGNVKIMSWKLAITVYWGNYGDGTKQAGHIYSGVIKTLLGEGNNFQNPINFLTSPQNIHFYTSPLLTTESYSVSKAQNYTCMSAHMQTHSPWTKQPLMNFSRDWHELVKAFLSFNNQS